jgi:hypothetical protein
MVLLLFKKCKNENNCSTPTQIENVKKNELSSVVETVPGIQDENANIGRIYT